MKILRSGLWIVVVLFVGSCKKPAPERPNVVEAAIRVNVVNAQGQDLLNAPIIYDRNNISVSHLVNGKTYTYNQANSNSQTGFLLSSGLGTNVLKVYPSYQNTEDSSITLLQLGSTKVDTIRCEFTYGTGTVYCSKIWLNQQLKFSDVPQTNTITRVLTIIK